MEERKTAVIVLGIVAVIIIFITVIIPETRFRGTKIIAFRNCSVSFHYDDKDDTSNIRGISQKKLALCLCNTYGQKPDTALSNRIIQIYRQYGNRYIDSLGLYNNIDSIIKHKSELLDTMILLD